VALPKEKKRWWICEAGGHECHWEGHEVKKDSKPRAIAEGSHDSPTLPL
jgi:hypothetical protein